MARKAKETGEPQEGSSVSRVVAKLKKDKDVGSVIKTADEDLLSDVRYYISTGVATIDYAIGQPGIPSGKVTTIFGPEGSGKSTLAYNILAECQAMGGIGILVDSEQRYTKQRAMDWGINPDELIVIDGATLEQAFNAIEKIIDGVREDNADVPIVVIYDSLAGSPTEKRLEAGVGDVLVGTAARFVGNELPRLKLKLSRLGVALVIVNQLRSRVNMGGDPRTRGFELRRKVMGGLNSMLAEWPLLFESALMLSVESVGTIAEEDKEKPTGIRSRVKVRKCGLSPNEGHRAEFDLDYLKGPDKLGSLFELLEQLGYITTNGGGRYRVASEGEEAKTFFRKDFQQIVDNHPEFADIAREAPRLWMKGDD